MAESGIILKDTGQLPTPHHKWCYQPGNASIAELKHFRRFKPKVEVLASTFFQGLEEKKASETREDFLKIEFSVKVHRQSS